MQRAVPAGAHNRRDRPLFGIPEANGFERAVFPNRSNRASAANAHAPYAAKPETLSPLREGHGRSQGVVWGSVLLREAGRRCAERGAWEGHRDFALKAILRAAFAGFPLLSELTIGSVYGIQKPIKAWCFHDRPCPLERRT